MSRKQKPSWVSCYIKDFANDTHGRVSWMMYQTLQRFTITLQKQPKRWRSWQWPSSKFSSEPNHRIEVRLLWKQMSHYSVHYFAFGFTNDGLPVCYEHVTKCPHLFSTIISFNMWRERSGFYAKIYNFGWVASNRGTFRECSSLFLLTL